MGFFDGGRSGKRLVIAASVAMIGGALGISPVTTVAAPRIDGLYANLSQEEMTAVALIERLGGGQMGVSLGLHAAGGGVNLFTLRLVGSSRGCSQPVTSSTRTFSIEIEGVSGGYWRVIVGGASGGVWRDTNSAWLKTKDGVIACAQTFAYFDCFILGTAGETCSSQDRIGGHSRFRGDGHRGVVFVSGEEDNVFVPSAVLTGLKASTTYSLIASTSECDASAPPSTQVFKLHATSDSSGALGLNRTETVDRDDMITIASIRVKEAGGGVWSCQPMHITGILIA